MTASRLSPKFRFYQPLTAFAFLLVAARLLAAAFSPDQIDYSHRFWRTQDGLPQSKIQALAQTPDGYLWIGAPGGLVRFDGVRFVVFDRANTPALRDSSILSLLVATDKALWIGTEGGGLVHFQNGIFQTFGTKEGLTNLFVRSIRQDRANTLWVGTDRGFFRFVQGKFKRLEVSSSAVVTAPVTMAEDPAGKLWLGGGFGLRYEKDGQLISYPFPHSVRSLHVAHDGKLWIATSKGIWTLDTGNGQAAPLPQSGFAEADTNRIYQDQDSSFWVGTLGHGLFRILQGKITAYRADSILPDNTILSLFEDQQRNLWVGTQDGLLRLSKTVVTSLTTEDGLLDNSVSTISQDWRDILWMTTVTGKLYRIEQGKPVPVQMEVAGEAIRASTLFRDSHDVLWVGTPDRGIARIKRGNTTFYTKQNGLRSDYARNFQEDRFGNIWVATGSGLLRWNGNGFQNYYLEDGLSYGSTRVVMPLQHGAYAGDILVGTDGGLNRIHGERIVPDSVLTSFAGEKIWSISEETNGTIWLGTRGNGLFRLKNQQIAKLTTRNGLLSNSIYQILDDGHGRLWMSSPGRHFFRATQGFECSSGRNAATGLRDSIRHGGRPGIYPNERWSPASWMQSTKWGSLVPQCERRGTN